MKFCDKLVKQRKNNNMSQEQLADRLGVSRQAVSKWESGSSIPDMAKILELCKILNCNLEELVDDGISSNNENISNKIDINNYLKELLDFITRTINMFWSMTAGEKLKCIMEMLFILLILFTIWGITGNLVNSIFYNIFRMLPSKIYIIIESICSVIYGLFGLIAGTIIIIHIFKVRYLDYFITIEDNNVTDKSLEVPIESEHQNDNPSNKLKFIDKKKNKIIIRDPKHSTYSFFNFLLKIALLIIKFILLLVAIPCVFSFVGLFFTLTIVSVLLNNGLFFLGIVILIIGLIFLNFLILKFIYNFILNQQLNFKVLFYIFIIGLSLVGIGGGISFSTYLTFNKDPQNNKNIEYDTKELEINMTDNLILNFINHDQTEIITDNNLDNIKIEVTYCKDGYVKLENYPSGYYENDNYQEALIYEINYYDNNLNNDFIDDINYLIEEIKSKKRPNNEYRTITKIKISASSANIEKLKNNNINWYEGN